MTLPINHHRRVKHYHSPGDLHELTFSCLDRLPLLTNDQWQKQLAESVDRALVRYEFSLVAFVFMPEHVHLLVLPRQPAPDIEGFLAGVKQPYSFRIKTLLTETASPLLPRLTVPDKRRGTVFRYWQKGPGYDRNLNSSKAVQASIDYVHTNPVKRNLCQRATEWKWSSARWYMNDGQQVDPDMPKIDGVPPGLLEYPDMFC